MSIYSLSATTHSFIVENTSHFPINILNENTNTIYTYISVVFSVYAVVYTLSISLYAMQHFIIKWKENMWKDAPESQVIEQVKIMLRKHNDCVDLDTTESVITESIQMTKYCLPYRIECYVQGIQNRVKQLENV
jgi:hypothetical protein